MYSQKKKNNGNSLEMSTYHYTHKVSAPVTCWQHWIPTVSENTKSDVPQGFGEIKDEFSYLSF